MFLMNIVVNKEEAVEYLGDFQKQFKEWEVKTGKSCLTGINYYSKFVHVHTHNTIFTAVTIKLKSEINLLDIVT